MGRKPHGDLSKQAAHEEGLLTPHFLTKGSGMGRNFKLTTFFTLQNDIASRQKTEIDITSSTLV